MRKRHYIAIAMGISAYIGLCGLCGKRNVAFAYNAEAAEESAEKTAESNEESAEKTAESNEESAEKAAETTSENQRHEAGAEEAKKGGGVLETVTEHPDLND